MFGTGISREGEILDLAVVHKVVQKSGAWFSYGDVRLGQGRENVKTFLRDNPELAAELRALVVAAASPAKVEETPASAAAVAPAKVDETPAAVTPVAGSRRARDRNRRVTPGDDVPEGADDPGASQTPRVTGLEVQQRDSGRLNVFVDGELRLCPGRRRGCRGGAACRCRPHRRTARIGSSRPSIDGRRGRRRYGTSATESVPAPRWPSGCVRATTRRRWSTRSATGSRAWATSMTSGMRRRSHGRSRVPAGGPVASPANSQRRGVDRAIAQQAAEPAG